MEASASSATFKLSVKTMMKKPGLMESLISLSVVMMMTPPTRKMMMTLTTAPPMLLQSMAFDRLPAVVSHAAESLASPRR